MYTIVMDNRTAVFTYLIVKQSDIGHYIVAECYSLDVAKAIQKSLEAAEKAPAPF